MCFRLPFHKTSSPPPIQKDLSVPELTGRRRYRSQNFGYGNIYAIGRDLEFERMVLEVEEAVFTEVGGKQGWEIRWRHAEPKDLPGETIVGLPSQGS